MIHDCDPFAGDKCNTIRLTTSNTIPYYFAPVIGINTGNTGTVAAASCKGACGAAMSSDRRRHGARPDRQHDAGRRRQREERRAARSSTSTIRADQWIGHGLAPVRQGLARQPRHERQVHGVRRSPNDTAHVSGLSPNSGLHLWWATSGLSSNYKTAATGAQPRVQPRPGDQLPGCERDDCVYSTSQGGAPSGNHTNLGDPLDAARAMLAAQGRADRARRDHLHDGRPGEPAQHDAAVRLLQQQGHHREERRADDLHDRLRPRQSTGELRELRRRRRSGTSPRRSTSRPRRRSRPTTGPARAVRSRTRTATTTSAPRRTADLEPVFRQVAAAAIETAHLID